MKIKIISFDIADWRSRGVSILRKFKRKVAKARHAPRVLVEPVKNLRSMGSVYGSWTFLDEQDLRGSTIISAGLGEDASFDVEFASTYGAKVVIVDPTPRAIAHFNAITSCIGQPSTEKYNRGGIQPVSAYSLDRISEGQLVLVEKALWTVEGRMRFYEPDDPKHVSHSITFKSPKGRYLEVESTTLSALLASIGVDALSIIKMDIEGAEAEILDEIERWPVLPNQLLIEFDVMRNPSLASRKRVEELDYKIRRCGYLCRYFDGERNYLYVLH